MIPGLVPRERKRRRRRYGLLPTSRAALVAAIHRHKPWHSNTGPRTLEGKKISSLNAMKHGFYSRFAASLPDTAGFTRLMRQMREMASIRHNPRPAEPEPILANDSNSDGL
jgi:hypothetical protein